MSKRKQKYDNLPKHQRKIVLCLAKEGPMNISETNKKIKGEYTSTNRAFHELETKEMITKSEEILYRGRQFHKYWLTIRGSGFALLNDVNPEHVRLHALKLCEKEEEKRAIETYFKLRKISPKMANILDRFILLEGKIEPIDLLKQLLPEMVSMDKNQISSILGVAKNDEYWKYFEQTIRKFIGELERAINNE